MFIYIVVDEDDLVDCVFDEETFKNVYEEYTDKKEKYHWKNGSVCKVKLNEKSAFSEFEWVFPEDMDTFLEENEDECF
jgi:hypothetical protein